MPLSGPLDVAVIGAGGIGAALVDALLARPGIERVHLVSRGTSTPPAEAIPASVQAHGDRLTRHALDVTRDDEVADWAAGLTGLDWLINTVGMLHDAAHGPEKTIRQFAADHLLESVRINCLPSLLLARHCHSLLKRSERGVFATVSARVGSIEDNALGGWYSYRASKAALNMSLKCLAIEWQRSAKSIRVAALHPGTTDTPLSRPFQANVPDGKLFTPAFTAGKLLERIDSLHEAPSGQFLAWDGEPIPW